MIAGIEETILHWVSAVYQSIGLPGLVLLMAVESACIPLPSEVVMPLAGWMLGVDNGYDISCIWWLALLGAAGNLLGSWLSYAAGAYGGRALLDRYGKYILITSHDLDLADRWFTRYGELTAMLSRVLPMVRTFVSLPAGISRMNFWKFSIYTFIGAYPWCLGLAYGGYKLGANWETLHVWMQRLDIPIAVSVFGFISVYIWHHIRRFRKHSAASASASESTAGAASAKD